MPKKNLVIFYPCLFALVMILFIINVRLLWAQTVEPQANRLSLTIGTKTLQVELANTPALRERGLMFRKTLPDNHGMLFVFPRAKAYCFWMKNTYVPLTLLFINDKGTIQDVYDMQPESETAHCASAPVRYALEVNQDWIIRHQLQAEKKVNGLIPLFSY